MAHSGRDAQFDDHVVTPFDSQAFAALLSRDTRSLR
jgi:hypothetical protein